MTVHVPKKGSKLTARVTSDCDRAEIHDTIKYIDRTIMDKLNSVIF